MRFLPLLAILLCSAHAETVDITVSIEVVKAEKICAKAIAILTKAANIEKPAEFLLVDGKPNTAKCLEVIYESSSSPTNGYKAISAQQYSPKL